MFLRYHNCPNVVKACLTQTVSSKTIVAAQVDKSPFRLLHQKSGLSLNGNLPTKMSNLSNTATLIEWYNKIWSHKLHWIDKVLKL